jgi:hypothetical protein
MVLQFNLQSMTCVGNFMVNLFDDADLDAASRLHAVFPPQAKGNDSEAVFVSIATSCIDARIVSASATRHLHGRQTEAHLPLCAPSFLVDHFKNAGMMASPQEMNKIKHYMEQQRLKTL